ncbi:1-aminocyclopropane-1-carboxylate deaminase [Alkanindiges hydrocarboniclasticus]|uniref:1-aminocyclopropane-1-carboxylate deaminase n=1 Tax=Alkanindiges hydrocarboniclasticus TaxID=1907941 RepID=A0A1S8CVK7_9GAMM|nr:pyridoxal-phosphate dependent enzyme [Alkanindiges hydrocarboniclasticus]ONG39541.1 1-aminocyclopropane-1-carboxylate deaminase [Alkanindiges hydrocarboniclasticus]
MRFDANNSVNEQLDIPFPNNISVFIKREDLLHSQISGNKFRKLKYNLIKARQLNQRTLLTFGGAYSNHIAAVAAAGHEFGFNTIGIIRGEELLGKINDNPTLRLAQQQGMRLVFISRADYRRKTEPNFIQALQNQFGEFYLIPEGGTNALAVQGCTEILTAQDKQQFDYICCAVGTGGTIAGLIESSTDQQMVLGFPALKGDFLQAEIQQWTQKTNWELIPGYHWGGYAKTTPALLQFVQDFYGQNGIEIEPVYTGKMLFGIFDLIQQGYFPAHSQILVIHTGGLQGNLSTRFNLSP